jgi:hypothetical protein
VHKIENSPILIFKINMTSKFVTFEAFVTRLGNKKGKSIPLQTWTGPEGSRSLRLPDFKTIDT